MQGGAARPGEVYFEHVRFGNTVKVSAIDADSGVEVSIIGPSSASRQSLETLALRKLQAALARKR